MNTLLSFILGIVTSVSGYGVLSQQSITETVDQLGSSMTSSVWLLSGGLPKWYATVTDGCAEWSSNVLTSTGSDCGGGGGLHVDGTGFVYPQTGDYHSAPKYVATSTTAASTFVLASSTNLTVTGSLWATLTGNADTATALSANGANCSAGNSPLGVDASGAVESCFDVWTEAENTAAGYGTGSVTSVAASVPTGWTVSGSPITTTGTLALAYDTGYAAVLTASTTNWNSFYDTPSTVISAGDALTWSTNTLNFDGGNAPGGELGGTWASPTIDDSLAVASWNLTTPTFTTNFTFDGVTVTGLSGSDVNVITGTAGTSGNCVQWNADGDIVDAGAACGVGGGSGAGWATTTDGGVEVTYTTPTNPVYIGGSASNTAEFIFDYRTSVLKIASSTAATSTIADQSSNEAIRLMGSTTEGIEFDFGTAGDIILRGLGSVLEFVSDLAFTLTGVLDFGSATSLEIPNATNPTVDANGEIAINTSTTSIRFYNGAEYQIKPEFPLFGATFASSSLAYDGSFGNSGTTTEIRAGFKYGVTVTELYCKTDTSSAYWAIGDGTSTTTLNCTTSGTTNSSPSLSFTGRENIYNDFGTTTTSVPNKIYTDVTGRWTTD